MQRQKLSIAAMCSRCGELFDLSYDILKTGHIEELENNLIKKRVNIDLCWECRFNS